MSFHEGSKWQEKMESDKRMGHVPVQKKQDPTNEQHQNHLIYLDEFRKLLNQFNKGEISISKFCEIINDKHRAAVTSLLEELPEVDKTEYSAIIYQTAYREKIKSLIQTKLK